MRRAMRVAMRGACGGQCRAEKSREEQRRARIMDRHLRNARAVDNSSHDVAAVVRDTATGGDAA